MPKKYLTNEELLGIIEAKTGYKKSTIQNVLDAFTTLMVAELQTQGKIRIRDLGDFTAVIKGGEEELITNAFGNIEKMYVARKEFVEFEPSKTLIDKLNGNRIVGMSREDLEEYTMKVREESMRAKDTTETYEDYVGELLGDEGDLDTMLLKTASQRKNFNAWFASQRNGEEYVPVKAGRMHNKHKIKCLTNGITYESVQRMAKDLGIDAGKIYRKIWAHKNYVDGYQFELLD